MFKQTEYLEFENYGILYYVIEIIYIPYIDTDYYDVYNFDVILN